MSRASKFSPEVRERSVKMVLEHQDEYESQWAAIVSIAAKIGCSAQTLHNWVAQAERDVGAGDREDEPGHPAVGAVDAAGGEHQLRKGEEQRRPCGRGEQRDEHAVPHDHAMVGIGRAQLFGEAALEAEGGELGDEFDDEHREGEAPDRFGAIPAARDVEEGQARDEAEDEAEEIGATALGERSGIGVARRIAG